jgi:hypothetical protein
MFLGVSRQGEFQKKTPYKYFCKKSMSKTFPKTIDKKIDVSFSSISPPPRFWVFLSDGSSKTQQKT